MYFLPDRGAMRELMDRAFKHGYQAVVITVDAPAQGVRDREQRSRFCLPPGIRAVNLPQTSPLTPSSAPRKSSAENRVIFDDLMHKAPTWNDIAWIQSQSPLPVLLKGILHPDDARQAVALQCAGVVVSNHGGRTLDTAVATAQALPRIADAVQGDLAVVVDGGITRGTDIVKALALGAHAVLLGRPYIYALAHSGAQGVAQALRLLRDEFELAMALCGCRKPGDLTRALLC
jgi:4-hydroxymandelate oxidase